MDIELMREILGPCEFIQREDRRRKMAAKAKEKEKMRRYKNRPWSEEDDRYLTEYFDTYSAEYIARQLKRTAAAVKTRAYVLRKSDAPTTPADNSGKDLCLWYVAQAYEEGHEIQIPALGAAFRKEADK